MLMIVGAKEGSRTPTSVTSQDPESCASTSSATFAKLRTRHALHLLAWGQWVVNDVILVTGKANG